MDYDMTHVIIVKIIATSMISYYTTRPGLRLATGAMNYDITGQDMIS